MPIYGDVTSRVKKKFEEIMEANMWLSDLLLDRVANKTGVQSKFLGGGRVVDGEGVAVKGA